jgi:YD repeat-containing protein
MQPQTVSVMKKCGTGVAPVDNSRCTFANKLTNITAGSATASHRYAYDAAGNLTNLVSRTATGQRQLKLPLMTIKISGSIVHKLCA